MKLTDYLAGIFNRDRLDWEPKLRILEGKYKKDAQGLLKSFGDYVKKNKNDLTRRNLKEIKTVYNSEIYKNDPCCLNQRNDITKFIDNELKGRRRWNIIKGAALGTAILGVGYLYSGKYNQNKQEVSYLNGPAPVMEVVKTPVYDSTKLEEKEIIKEDKKSVGEIYTIKKGDSLYKIAKKYGNNTESDINKWVVNIQKLNPKLQESKRDYIDFKDGKIVYWKKDGLADLLYVGEKIKTSAGTYAQPALDKAPKSIKKIEKTEVAKKPEKKKEITPLVSVSQYETPIGPEFKKEPITTPEVKYTQNSQVKEEPKPVEIAGLYTEKKKEEEIVSKKIEEIKKEIGKQEKITPVVKVKQEPEPKKEISMTTPEVKRILIKSECDNLSVVDTLNEKNLPSDFKSRKKLWSNFSKEEKYKGTAGQNEYLNYEICNKDKSEIAGLYTQEKKEAPKIEETKKLEEKAEEQNDITLQLPPSKKPSLILGEKAESLEEKLTDARKLAISKPEEQGQVSKYVEDQMLSERNVPESIYNTKKGIGNRLGNDFKDAGRNLENLFGDIFFGAKKNYVVEDGSVKTTKKSKGVLGSVFDGIKNIVYEGPKNIVKGEVGTGLKNMFWDGTIGMVGNTLQAGGNIIDDGVGFAVNGVIEPTFDLTIGNLHSNLSSVPSDALQTIVDFSTDIIPGNEAWMRVHDPLEMVKDSPSEESEIKKVGEKVENSNSEKSENKKHENPIEERYKLNLTWPIVNNWKTPEFAIEGDNLRNTVRNTKFRKIIETSGSLAADLLVLDLFEGDGGGDDGGPGGPGLLGNQGPGGPEF